MIKRLISISLSPNVEKDDLSLTLGLLFRPWEWKKGNYINSLEEGFKDYFKVKYAFAFNSGRSALFAILKALEEEKGSEVLLQAYTCNASVNPVLWAGLKPVYTNPNEDDFNLDFDDAESKITPKSKILMVQHTFGMPADMDRAKETCNRHNLTLVEDCAHCIGGEYKGKKAGTFGRAAFFSFSRDKAISSVYGGMAITNDEKLAEKLKKIKKEMDFPSIFWIFQQIFHPIFLNYFVIPIYYFINLGKILLVLFQKLNLISKAVHYKEKRGKRPSYFPKKMPNAMAKMALHQFKKLDKFNNHRREIADFYYNELKGLSYELPKRFENRQSIFLRFTLKYPQAHGLIRRAWKRENILIGDWYTSPVAPYDTNFKKVKYLPASCLMAEKLARTTFNLPTHINISETEAKKIVNFLKNF